LRTLPGLLKKHTDFTISESKHGINSITSGLNWYYPDARMTLEQIDKISNECCKVIDSALILYKNYSEGNKPVQDALVDTMNSVNDFFGSEYLNQNQKLLAMLIKL
jgi:hypothetical protein